MKTPITSWIRFTSDKRPNVVNLSVRKWHPGWWWFLYKTAKSGLSLELRFGRRELSVPSGLLALIAVPYLLAASTARSRREK